MVENDEEFPYDIRLFEDREIGCGVFGLFPNASKFVDLASNTRDYCKDQGSPILCNRKLVQW